MPVPRIEGDLRRITKDWEAGSNPWTKQESYRPDLFDALKEESRKEDNLRKTRNRYLRAIAASQHRATHERSLFHVSVLRMSVAIAARIIDGDAFYILAGALLALDLVITRLLWVSM